MTNQIQTLFGGKPATVLHEDGSSKEIRVRQLRLVEYERAFSLIEDEIAFTAFCCSHTAGPAGDAATVPFTKDWALTLQPESFEILQALVQEVNAGGFFSYASRRKAREQQQMMATLEKLTPEQMLVAAEIGGVKTSSGSATSLPRPRPTPKSR